MAKKQLNDKLYGLLDSRGYRPDMYDSSGKKVAVPEEAELLQFSFVKDGEDYGRATVTIDGSHRLVVYYNDKIAQSPKAGSQDSQSWDQLMRHLRKFAINYQLGFERKDVDDLESDMAVRAHTKKEGLAESYHPMGKKQSYNDVIPETKIIIKHSKQMEEGEQRFRSVEKIFIETSQGERFLAPTNKPGIAQIYARHIAEGGKPNDDRWTHISEMCEEYNKMSGFVRATRGKQFNESTEKIVNEGLNHYSKLRECLSKMRGKKGYSTYFESWSPTLQEDEVSEDLSEMFMSSSLDPRIESVMPILSKLSKSLGESTTMAEVIALENWADEITTHKGGKISKTPTGIKHQAGPDQYGGSLPDEEGPDDIDKTAIGKHDKKMGVKWDREKKWGGGIKVDETNDDYVDPKEADYGDKYQKSASNAGEAVKRIEKKLGKVDIAALAKKLNRGETTESLDADQKSAGQLGPTGRAAKQGDLVGEASDPLAHVKKLSGL